MARLAVLLETDGQAVTTRSSNHCVTAITYGLLGTWYLVT